MPERPETRPSAGPPREPPPTRWALPDPRAADGDLVGLGADLEPGTLLAAYRAGFFPMRVEPGGPIGWWSPDPRGVIPLEGGHAARSLRRSARRYNVTVDTAFPAVVAGCADPSRPHGWIDDSFQAAYARLHELGWAHSVEVWTTGEGSPRLAGGLYGVAIGGFFAGESMFHRARDASKVALLHLVESLPAAGGRLFDVQWCTPHLETLGAVALPRDEYLARLADAVRRPALRLR
ncbi:MAG TPA: leucyl/phenylalanyl-tRNA--protein transferase [Acidimicrobiia bacterium]|jgi:leucyl/phenylalanyl-tRNA--protein transferase